MAAGLFEQTAGKNTLPGGFFVRALLVITVFAWLMRIGAAWEMAQANAGANNVFAPPPTSDLATYMTLGKACAAGDFPETFYYQPYYYAVFLALINLVSGAYAVYVCIFMQSLLSAATVFLTGWCAKMLFGEKAGIAAAVLTTFSSSLILYVPFHQNETLQSFHLILLFFISLSACRKDSWRWYGGAGGVAGVAILTRGNIWLLVPVMIFFIFRSCNGGMRRKVLMVLLFLFCMTVVQLPFIIRNTLACGSLQGASTAANAVLAIGNGVDAPAGGRNPWERAGAMYYSESYRRMMANTTGEFAKSVPAQILEWAADDPLGFLELQLRKALLFWDGREIPNNVSLVYDGEAHSFIMRYLAWNSNRVLLALGLAGIIWFIPGLKRGRKNRELWMLYAFTFVFYLAVVMFYILSRFKAPLLPLLAIFGGGAVCSMWYKWRDPAPGKASVTRLTVILTLLTGTLPVNGGYEWYRELEAPIQRMIHPDGLVLNHNAGTLMYQDHGAKPFGGWLEHEAVPGMVIVKRFANVGTVPAEIQIVMQNIEPVHLVLKVNGRTQEFVLPPYTPGKGMQKIVRLAGESVVNGLVVVEFVSISGGTLEVFLDLQRDYGRSGLNGKTVAGEWVIRAVVPQKI